MREMGTVASSFHHVSPVEVGGTNAHVVLGQGDDKPHGI